jgi:O-antigen ligase
LANLTQTPALAGAASGPLPAASSSSTSAVAFTIFHTLGFWSLLVFLLVAFSRVNEFIHIPYAVKTPMLVCLAMGFLTTGLFRAMSSRPGILMLALTFWMCVSTPFSVWRGGSVRLLVETWLISLLIFFGISSAIHTFEQCRKAMYAMAGAALLIVLLSFRFGRGVRLSFAWGTLGNPNDFAAFLLLGAPFCLYVFFDQPRLSLAKAAAIAGLAGILILCLRTGSRAGFVTILGIGLVMFWKLSLNNKIKLVIIGLLVAPLLVPFIPSSIWHRLTTFGAADAEERAAERQVRDATSSYWARRRLLFDALELTVRNPLVGVGPGQFAPASAGMAQARGAIPMWRETHNTYLQLSSETGLPGLTIYLLLLAYCFRTMTLIRREAARYAGLTRLALMADCIYMVTGVFAFVSLFGSYGYAMMLPAYTAFAEALHRTSRPLVRAAAAASASMTPAPPETPQLRPASLARI